MSKVIVIFIVLYSSISIACKLGPNSQWNLSEDKLAKATKVIVVARLEEILAGRDAAHSNLKFRVLKVKKGKYKEKFVTIKDAGKTESENLTYGKECNFEFNYKLSQDYLIYVDTMNPRSIHPVESVEK